jgi:hypothetical protein
VPRRKFESKGEEVGEGDWRRLHNEELKTYTPNVITVVESRRMG